MPDLDDVLNGTGDLPPVELTTTEPPAELDVPPEPQTTEPTGEPAATPVATEPPDVAGLKAALHAERQKRQQYEDYIRQQQAQAEQPPPPDIWENPQEFVRKEVTEVASRLEQQFNTRILNMSEAAARSRYQDFDAKMEIYGNLIQKDPVVWQRMMGAPDPAEFAYRTAENFQAMQELGNPLQYKEKVRAEIEAEVRAKVEAEYKQNFNQELTRRIPASMTEVRAAGNNQPTQWTGPTPLGDILK